MRTSPFYYKLRVTVFAIYYYGYLNNFNNKKLLFVNFYKLKTCMQKCKHCFNDFYQKISIFQTYIQHNNRAFDKNKTKFDRHLFITRPWVKKTILSNHAKLFYYKICVVIHQIIQSIILNSKLKKKCGHLVYSTVARTELPPNTNP